MSRPYVCAERAGSPRDLYEYSNLYVGTGKKTNKRIYTEKSPIQTTRLARSSSPIVRAPVVNKCVSSEK